MHRFKFLIALYFYLVPFCFGGFLDAIEWKKDQAEILTYEVKKNYLGKELKFKALFVTEGSFYDPAKEVVNRKATKGSKPVFNFSLNYNFTRDHYKKSIQADLLFLHQAEVPLIYQNVSIQDWDNPGVRKLYAVKGKPVLEYQSRKNLDAKKNLEKSPVFTVEQLFFYLRTISHNSGYSEKIWLLGSLCEDKVPTEPVFAEIRVMGKRMRDEKESQYITVLTEAGKKYEYYLSDTSLPHILYAAFPNGMTWSLKAIKFKRYWFF